MTACFLLTANVSDYEASLKKEGGIPDGPVLESLLAGETLDKKVETKEEESMSECQVRPAGLCGLFSSACVTLCFCLSLALCRSVVAAAAAAQAPAAPTTFSWLCTWVCALVITCDCAAAKRVFQRTTKTHLFIFNLVFFSVILLISDIKLQI